VTLRARLTIALVALLAVGLVAANVVTYTELRSFLVRRVDQQLRASWPQVAQHLSAPDPFGEGGPGSLALPGGTYVALFDAGGKSLGDAQNPCYGCATPPPPNVPATVLPAGPPGSSSLFTLGPARSAGPDYRAIAVATPGDTTLILAIPLTDVSQTLGRLVWIGGAVTIAVLIGMALLSLWTVRRELRPLERIEDTAGAIAGGDLSRRVEPSDPNTEVGRLGIALNGMLGRIEEAMDERRASEAALRRFLADASHELRTPLTSIRGYAELFRRGADADPGDTAIAMRRIEQESGRMGVLVDDLLFLARAGHGRPVAHDPVDLVRVADDAVLDARALDGSRTISLTAPAQLIVMGDESRLRQVCANLLSNALAHTPPGTAVRVRVAKNDREALLEVQDEGPGVDPEEAAHVFEPFYRADPSRGRGAASAAAEDGSGTGLGLAIVAAVAEAHAGTASVHSVLGEGATFTVRFPLAGIGDDEQVPSATDGGDPHTGPATLPERPDAATHA
jgi:two-component system OmpR family sensor kinase